MSFNECTSLLQRGAEDMEYVDLLSIAVTKTTSVERCAYVAAFAASEYASTVNRVAKPFNPLLVFPLPDFSESRTKHTSTSDQTRITDSSRNK